MEQIVPVLVDYGEVPITRATSTMRKIMDSAIIDVCE
jgi:hypothetical protein